MDSKETIYKEYAVSVYKFLLSKSHNSDISEELTQETFYQAIKSINTFKGNSSMLTWLCSIANHVWISYLREQTKSNVISEDIANLEVSYEEKFLSKESKFEALKILHNLKDPYREIVYLRLYGDMCFKDIGLIFSKSETWARVTYFRAIQKIKGEWYDE